LHAGELRCDLLTESAVLAKLLRFDSSDDLMALFDERVKLLV